MAVTHGVPSPFFERIGARSPPCSTVASLPHSQLRQFFEILNVRSSPAALPILKPKQDLFSGLRQAGPTVFTTRWTNSHLLQFAPILVVFRAKYSRPCAYCVLIGTLFRHSSHADSGQAGILHSSK